MSPELLGIIGLVVLFIFIFLGMPIGASLALTAFIGMIFLLTFGKSMSVIGTSPFSTINSYTLSVLPLFVLMGEIASVSGVAEEAYSAFNKWIGHFSGGMGMVTIGACAAFSAICGSSVANAVAMGKVALPEMHRYGYDRKLAAATVVCGGTLGILIPPSSGFIIYAIVTDQSVGALFMAGVIPGVLLTILMALTIYIIAKVKPSLAPAGVKSSWSERFKALKGLWKIVILFLAIMGGIWFGVFTPTEAAGVSVIIAFAFLLLKRGLNKNKAINGCLKNTVQFTGMAFVIIIGAMIFNYFMALSRLPNAMAVFLTSLDINPYFILAIIIIFYIFLGCIMETISMILLTVPIVFPTILALGFDPIWFGVIIVLLQEIALITPPIGINVFVIAAEDHLPVYDVFRGVVPFFVTFIVCMIILVAFPQISLWLPGTMK